MFLVKPERRRLLQLAATVVVIALGLASRAFPQFVPDSLGKYPGDALWAMMIVFGWASLPPACAPGSWRCGPCWSALRSSSASSTRRRGSSSCAAHTLGHLVLGSFFGWADLIAYTAGVAVAAIVDNVALFKRR